MAEGTTWTVIDRGLRVISPIEEYLDFLRGSARSPNTVKSYALGLARYWSYLELIDVEWDAATLATVGGFMAWLRRGMVDRVVELFPTRSPAPATVLARVRAVMSFYRFQQAMGTSDVASALYETRITRPGSYKPFLEHVARRTGRIRSRLGRSAAPKPVPVLLPDQVRLICDAAARREQASGVWTGNLRNRFLWELLSETGLRLGEALSLRHADWYSSRGDVAYITVTARPHPHGIEQKGDDRRIYIGSRLDRLYGDYLWLLLDQGLADNADMEDLFVFCNLHREPRFSPLRAETVYDHVDAIKRQHPSLPAAWTPHWFRHTHATALLLAGVSEVVVSRRLGHRNIQTTINTYAHVTADAEMRAAANWRAFTAGWGTDASQAN